MKITRDLVRALLDYDPQTGVLTWKARDENQIPSLQQRNRWNNRFDGKPAGYEVITPAGYRYLAVTILGHPYKAHRIAWLWMTSQPLPKQIDHIDRDGTNNAWDNLRPSSAAENSLNRSKHNRNSSGVAGVSWNKQAGKWHARISFQGKSHHLGLFTDLQDAIDAREDKKTELGFSHNHGSDAPYRS